MAPLVLEGETLMVDPKEVENGGLQVVDMDGVFNDVYSVVVGLPVTETCFYTTPGEPVGKAIGVMISAVVGASQFALAVYGSPEFSTPDNKRVFQHAALLQVGQ